ncbi:MAG: cytochrome c oxidase subunit 3 [Pusillimonas sp.]|nr:cytochrome c oxidase subunit 3 [Pusillimonas sp.]
MRLYQRLHPGVNLGPTDPENHEEAEEKIFGFWIFLMSDLVLFSVLFATYAAMSIQGVAQGPSPKDIFDLSPVFLETMVLLASSFTFGLAILELKYRKNRGRLALWLTLTGLLGALFVGLELNDYRILLTEHGAAPQTSGFLSAYYLLTGTHALHVSVAIIWLIVLAVQLATLGPVGPVKLRLMRLALFWHMLDIIWIGIFTFVYLYGVVL